MFPLYLKTLRDYVKMSSIIQITCCMFTRDLLNAVSHIGSLQILHRDIKPSNCLVSKGQPVALVLADFGAALEMKVSTKIQDKFIPCTPGYESPEMLQNKPYGLWHDWWSVGVTLLETASGVAPFGHQGPTHILMEIYEKFVANKDPRNLQRFVNM